MILGVTTALAAGGCFAAAGVLQQRVAATRPRDESLSLRLIGKLARERVWLAGIGLAVLSYLFQALALSDAPLSVVQPLLISEVLFAIPISVRLHGMRLRAREWMGVAAVAGGLAMAIVLANPRPGHPIASIMSWLPVIVILGVLTLVGVAVGRRRRGPQRAAAYAFAAAIIMGLEAAFMDATTRRFEGGVVNGFTSWEPYAMAVCSLTGLLLIQSAFQAGPLAASMPVADGVEPLVAIGVGLALFGDKISSSTVHLVFAALGIAILLVGVVLLDTSPVVQRVNQQEDKQQQRTRDTERNDTGAVTATT
ncbi:MAG TPA: DMT family transporter [Mycobacteriales bacterium]|nr:DMT family transporter [Mycobacteriales bacterium]